MIDGRIMLFQVLVGMILSSIILSVVSTAFCFFEDECQGNDRMDFLFSDDFS